MYGRSNNTILIMFILVVIPLGMFALLNYTDHVEINIDKSYIGELNSCQLENSELQSEIERIQPICPDVKCDSSDKSWVLGWFIGACTTYLFMNNKYKIFSKKKTKKSKSKAKSEDKN